VSSFGGRDKKTAWEIWKVYEVTPAFCALTACPSLKDVENWLYLLEQFIILLYDHTSSKTLVNEARKELFTCRGRAIDALPPTC